MGISSCKVVRTWNWAWQNFLKGKECLISIDTDFIKLSRDILHCPLFSQHWNYWKPVKPKKSVTTLSGNSQHFQTLANFWSRACIFHRVFVQFSLQSCWDEAGRMRDERGKKKLEVLISSSSQVKILLTMDDQRGRKVNQTESFWVLKKEIQNGGDKWRNVHHIKDIRMTPLPSDTL